MTVANEAPRDLILSVHAFLTDIAPKIATKLAKQFALEEEEITESRKAASLIDIYSKSKKRRRTIDAETIQEAVVAPETVEPIASSEHVNGTPNGTADVLAPTKGSKKLKRKHSTIDTEVANTTAAESSTVAASAPTADSDDPVAPSANGKSHSEDAEASPEVTNHGSGKKSKTNKGTPFQRVKIDEVTYFDESLKDNSFHSKTDEYGMRAHQDLIVTRGKGFRAEKTKKKRGSYRGGPIDTSVSSSFKFKYSDDEE
ncbi:hypothetical protein SmJEL517_g03838 [Synchytrium microbalum]|uniref:Srp40 C-terminal domain-containing protein n=1 Tax=Synchytrium microbalum TaxID=1806994 RepID=A0A507BUM6_9FUNG|nr:uncharacterized protein SmJEL517_g03838 [Synchytrium microbalum]TPX33160.1 hypothetical protein SmJEL517_g03838 [Synchytrium microbalum]